MYGLLRRNDPQSGFSSTELLVVIAIIGILVGISTQYLSTTRPNARDKTRIANIQSLTLALDQYYSMCRRYPTRLEASGAEGCPTGTTLGSFLVVPLNDPLANPYTYATSSNARAYVLRAALETNLAALASDLDGTTNNSVSLDCTDTPTRYYCVGSTQ